MAHCLRLPAIGANVQLLKAASVCTQCMATTSTRASVQMDKYWKKNKELNRPLSPHLTIYKYHVPMVMSITNRITGSVVTAAAFGAPVIYLLGSKDFEGYMMAMQNWGSLGQGVIGLTKFTLAFSLSYHTIACLRHLLWDMAMGLRMEQVYISGYAILAASLLATMGLMCL